MAAALQLVEARRFCQSPTQLSGEAVSLVTRIVFSTMMGSTPARSWQRHAANSKPIRRCPGLMAGLTVSVQGDDFIVIVARARAETGGQLQVQAHFSSIGQADQPRKKERTKNLFTP